MANVASVGPEIFDFLNIHQIDSVPDNWYDFISPICVWELAEALLILSINSIPEGLGIVPGQFLVRDK